MVSGIAEGCRQAGCALIGGETAEMPGFYPEDEYDMAGFSVGMVDKEKMIDGTTIKPGDALIGVASSGVHSNGYSLVRKVIGVDGIKPGTPVEGRPRITSPGRTFAGSSILGRSTTPTVKPARS